MEFLTDSQHFLNATKEYRYCTKNDGELTMDDIEKILNEWHPSNFILYNEKMTNAEFLIRDDYYKVWKDFDLTNHIIETYHKIRTRSVESVKKIPNTFAITISPEISEYPINLVNCVKKLLTSKCVKNLYGVFEYGRNRHNFHTHFVVSFTDRNGKRNMVDSIKKKYKIFKVEQMGGPVHLLKTLRYFHKEDKLNRGIINKSSVDYFLELADGEAPIKFIQDSKEKIFNI